MTSPPLVPFAVLVLLSIIASTPAAVRALTSLIRHRRRALARRPPRRSRTEASTAVPHARDSAGDNLDSKTR